MFSGPLTYMIGNVKCDVGPCHFTVGDNLQCTLIFICDRLLNYTRSVLNIITMYALVLPVHSCALSVFLSKGNWKERKTSGAW